MIHFQILQQLKQSQKIGDAGEAGHLNEESGHGPWPEGTMVFAKFISELKDTTNNQTVKADD